MFRLICFIDALRATVLRKSILVKRMKTGKTLIELATEIQRQAESKRDYVAPTNLLQMTDEAKLEVIRLRSNQ
ncbi:MAG: hypothetical protein HC820_09205 [Hydrococcus sp. RM1_1_31]|nr:hypothetical protein [Hydrococcus sp. RM1_1_31]